MVCSIEHAAAGVIAPALRPNPYSAWLAWARTGTLTDPLVLALEAQRVLMIGPSLVSIVCNQNYNRSLEQIQDDIGDKHRRLFVIMGKFASLYNTWDIEMR